MTVLPMIWIGIIGFVILTYVVLDGFDLGIGVLFPWIHDELHRDTLIQTIAPVWDGNQTWMVLGAACLYGAFPVVYSTILPTLYIPIIIMLAALIFRGISFEFRHKAKHAYAWNHAFAIGSIIVSFCQGVILGTFVQGYDEGLVVHAPQYYQWLTPFSLFTGIAVCVGYALLGSCWAIKKTTGELQELMFHFAKLNVVILSIFLIITSLWTPFMNDHLWQRWFTFPDYIFLAPLPLITMGIIYWNWLSIQAKHDFKPILLSIGIFLCAFVGFIISLWPYVIPYHLTIWQAASAPKSLIFMLVGVIILLPVLIGYTAYSYVVFRGKVTHETKQYYHE